MIISVCKKNSKSPGADEYTAYFYFIFFFRKDITFNIYAVSINLKEKKILNSQKFGRILWIITKRRTIKTILEKNWRPITFLNTLYGILSRCLTLTIEIVLKIHNFKYTVWLCKGHIFCKEYSLCLWVCVLYRII